MSYKPATRTRYSKSKSSSSNPADTTRRRLCTTLGRQALAQAPLPQHEKWLHDSGPVNPAPSLPVGNYYTMVNHIKVLQQYTELLSEAASGQGPHAAILHGSSESCGYGFEWFAPLCSPLLDSGFGEYFENLVKDWRSRNPGLCGNAEAVYRAYLERKKIDMDCTRYIVSILKPDSKEYEARVAKNILDASPSSFDEFQSEFLGWRKRGLYHALCLAANFMPSPEDWVPSNLMSEADELSELLAEFKEKNWCSKHRLADILDRMGKRSDLFSNCVSGTLDRVATLMRVPSDTGSEDLGDREEDTLDDLVQYLKFEIDSENPYKDSFRFWRTLKKTFEQSLPPSLLCPALDPPSRGTWGYPRLSLKINEDTGKLYIDHPPLQWMDRSSYQSLKDEGIFYEPERLRDILFRMGEAVTSPELGQLLFTWRPLEKILKGEALDTKELETYKSWHADRSNVLKEMSSMHPWMRDCTLSCRALDIKRDILDLVPKPKEQQHSPPLRLLAYRLDCPSRVLLYQGVSSEIDLDHTPPHAMRKISYPDRVQNRTVSGIALLKHDESRAPVDTHDAIRSLIAHEVAAKHSDFADHPFHRNSIKDQDTKQLQYVTSTTLAESVAVFTGPKPSGTSHVGLNESTPWEGERIDHRYAEHQVGENGTRYRDWATMYHEGDELHRSRLASHEVKVEQTYYTHFPVAEKCAGAGSPQKYSWLSVCSSLPAELCVLRDLGGHSRLESLKRSVENRFMNDSKLLPVRFTGDTIERGNMEIYTDDKAGQVMIAYAPSGKCGEKRSIEMISFRFCG